MLRLTLQCPCIIRLQKPFLCKAVGLQEMRKEKSVQRQQCPALTAMAMTMKPLIIPLLLVVTVAMRMPLSVAVPYTNII